VTPRRIHLVTTIAACVLGIAAASGDASAAGRIVVRPPEAAPTCAITAIEPMVFRYRGGAIDANTHGQLIAHGSLSYRCLVEGARLSFEDGLGGTGTTTFALAGRRGATLTFILCEGYDATTCTTRALLNGGARRGEVPLPAAPAGTIALTAVADKTAPLPAERLAALVRATLAY
jgi:hypothetical protein